MDIIDISVSCSISVTVKQINFAVREFYFANWKLLQFLRTLNWAKIENLLVSSMQNLQFSGNLNFQIWAFRKIHEIKLPTK